MEVLPLWSPRPKPAPLRLTGGEAATHDFVVLITESKMYYVMHMTRGGLNLEGPFYSMKEADNCAGAGIHIVYTHKSGGGGGLTLGAVRNWMSGRNPNFCIRNNNCQHTAKAFWRQFG